MKVGKYRNVYHCVQELRFMPVSAFVVLIAVLIRTLGSSAGLGPSKEGDQGPPIAIGSFLPLTPTRKLTRRVGCTKFSWVFSGSCDKEHDLWCRSSRLGQDISITCNNNNNNNFNHLIAQRLNTTMWLMTAFSTALLADKLYT